MLGDPYLDDWDDVGGEVGGGDCATFVSDAFASSATLCCPLSVIGFSMGGAVFSGTALSTSSFVGFAGAVGFDPPFC